MDSPGQYFRDSRRMTRLAEALASKLAKARSPLVSDYDIFLLTCEVYREGGTKYVRGPFPSIDTYKRTRALLKDSGIIAPDKDYSRLWAILSEEKIPADEAVCIADPSCYISRFSALQRYGLTLRNPRSLHLTQLAPKLFKLQIDRRLEEDKNLLIFDGVPIEHPRPTSITHPTVVRGRPIHVKSSNTPGEFRKIRGSHARVSTIGQTFLDTLSDPQLCGGMAHVLDIWEKHAQTYLIEIIRVINAATSGIIKVRAGYILNERLGFDDGTILSWLQHTQRGGSRRLDPSQPYKNIFSEKWEISINVEK